MLQVHACWPGYFSHVLCFYVIMHSCSMQIALSGEHPLIHTFAAAAPYDVDFFKKPFAARFESNQRHFCRHMHLVFTRAMQIIGITRFASHTFMDGSDSLVCNIDFDQSCSVFVQFHLEKPRIDPSPLVTSPIYIEASHFVFTYRRARQRCFWLLAFIRKSS